MSKIDIFDEEKIARLLHVQKAQGIDFNQDINWYQSIDMNRTLLPLNDEAILFPEASVEQRLVISQLLGLIVASTISELEDVAYKLKDPTWNKVLRKFPVNPELFELGEHFYEDEQKHSLAFKRYIDLFAEKVNVDPKDLREILPSSDKTFLSKIYHLDSMAGGMAIWWLIAAVEEESLLIFKHMRKSKGEIDPLYYNLHKCHYEEEVRHKSYASIMLEINFHFARVPHVKILHKLDFILAEILNLTWTFNQLFKLKKLKKLSNHHPFFETLSGLSVLLENRNSLEVMYKLFNSAPYVRDMLHLSDHMHIKLLLERFGVQKIPFNLSCQGEG